MDLSPQKRWTLLPPAPAALLSSTPEYPLLVHVLFQRGLTTSGEIRDFLEGSQAQRANPYLLRDMAPAVTRILRAIDTGEVICVYGDFDADGVTATALLVSALQAAGGKVGPYIPDRVDEGYGLNVDAIERIAAGATLIVTVDCGMRSVAEVNRANQLGVDVIITDHHTVGHELPPALAVINPRRADCPSRFDRLAGVGVAYRVAQAVLRATARRPHSPLSEERVAEIEDELLDLVALGTVADMMPLLGENRDLVRQGLHRLSSNTRPGLAALLAHSNLTADSVDAQAISFRLAPRINAAGRLDDAKLAYRLLRTNDPKQAQSLAQQLEELNQRRQSLMAHAQIEAEAQLAREGATGSLLLAASAHFRSGIVGLVAGKLAERYYRPAIVVEQGEHESRGSARSIREFDISQALDEVGDLLVRHGGHSRAAGFTVRTRDLPALAERLRAIADRDLAPHSDLRPTLEISADVPFRDLGYPMVQHFARLEPTGQENPQPLLLSRALRVRDARTVGDGKHLKLVIGSEEGALVWDAVGFHMGHLNKGLGQGALIDAVYSVELNLYMGQKRLQLNLRDLQSARDEHLPAAAVAAAQLQG